MHYILCFRCVERMASDVTHTHIYTCHDGEGQASGRALAKWLCSLCVRRGQWRAVEKT